MSTHIPPDWKKPLGEIVRIKGTIVLIGPTDSGKTTLAKYLIQKELQKGRKVAFIDGDVGQSTLGPPSTISLVFLRHLPASWEEILPGAMRFIGSTSPSGYLQEILSAVKAMLDKARSLEPDNVIVDTTGMIAGEEALVLKTHKINLLQPACILALEQEDELEHILAVLEAQQNFPIYRLKPSSHIRKKTPAERSRFRAHKFRVYFQGAVPRNISTKDIALKNLSPSMFKYQLVGLLDDNLEVLNLGIGYQWNEDSLEVITSLSVVGEIRTIKGSPLHLDPQSGEEME